MENYIVVSNSKKIPYDIEDSNYTLMTEKEFYTKATSDEGIEAEKIYYDITSLKKEMYEGLHNSGMPVEYYSFTEDVDLDFEIDEEITLYQDQTEPEKEPEPQIQPKKQSEPVKQPEPQNQPQKQSEPVVQTQKPVNPNEFIESNNIAGIDVVSSNNTKKDETVLDNQRMVNLLQYDDITSFKMNSKNAKTIVFGSSKGGTGKTFTCLLSAYRYAKTHPDERIALADFDIIDGQIGITIGKNSPTLVDYYKQYIAGNKGYKFLSNYIVKNDHFSANLDFYLAPPMDVPEVTNNFEFWFNVFECLIKNYDVVFFDSGIDYLGKEPISQLYKIADKIILTSNTSINSVKSIIKQLQTLSGRRKNPVFPEGNDILDRTYLVLTRVIGTNATNQLVYENLTKYAPIVAAFGNIDEKISKSQWYQQWEIWDYEYKVNEALDRITDFSE